MTDAALAERNTLASRNVWREYALELEQELEDIRRAVVQQAHEQEHYPRMEGQRLVRIK